MAASGQCLCVAVFSACMVLCVSCWKPPGMFQYPPAFLQPLPGPWPPCAGGPKACVCLGTVANCSLTEKYSGSAPLLLNAENITTLFFHNLLQKHEGVDDETGVFGGYFKNVDDITTVFVTSEHRAMKPIPTSFPRLKTLYLDLPYSYIDLPDIYDYDGDHLTYTIDDFEDIATLRELFLSRVKVDLSAPSSWFFPWRRRSKSQLTTLGLTSCEVIQFEMKALQRVQNLTNLIIDQTPLTEIPGSLPSLQYLSFVWVKLSGLPPTCDTKHRPLFPQLKYLVLDRNGIAGMRLEGHCLPSLQYLSIRSGSLGVIARDMFPVRSFPKPISVSLSESRVSDIESFAFSNRHFERLDMSRNTISHIKNFAFSNCTFDTIDLTRNSVASIRSSAFWNCTLKILDLSQSAISSIKEEAFKFSHVLLLDLKHNDISSLAVSAFGSTEIEKLDMRYCRTVFMSDEVNERAFDGSKGLLQLHLEGSDFKDIAKSKLLRLLAPLRSLRLLNLRKTRFPSLREGMFRPLKRLRSLLLQDNGITSVRHGAFEGLENLTILRLDNNFLTVLDESPFSSHALGKLESLNLSGNPFECTCDLLWLHQGLINNPALYDASNPYSSYDCNNLPGTRVVDTFVIIQQCLFSHAAYVFTVVCTSALIATLTSAMMLYRYRWHIRLVLYEAFRGNPQAAWRQRRPEEFQFDLFVCYDSEDGEWVVNSLMPMLEQDMELRLCVHQRDFIPGKNITDNILDCLQTSKRVLAIFSPSFAESQWCHFELELCLSHVVDNNDVMVVVILEHTPAREMSAAMMALLKTTTYIEWEEGQEAEASFWRRLTLALNDVLRDRRQ